MSDSSGTNTELDQYGVWIKTPPHTHQETAEEENTDSLSDFSFLDELPSEHQESTASDDMSADIMGDISPEGTGADETVSLDEFISDVSTEDEANIPTDNEGSSTEEMEDGEISLDDFFDGDSGFMEEETKEEEEEEDPLDIDLEFDDELDVQTVDNTDDSSFFDEPESTSSRSSSSGDSETEGVDLSDFFSDDSPVDQESNSDDAKATETVDVSEFDDMLDNISDNSKPKAEETSVADAGSTEDIDLSEFGLDGDSSENAPAEADEEDSEEDMKTNFDLSVSMEDEDSGTSVESNASDATEESISISIEPETEKPAESSGQRASVSSSDEEFDVDSLLDSIEDENGEKASLKDDSEAENRSAPVPETEFSPTVIVEAESETIPDTFDEETSSLSDTEVHPETEKNLEKSAFDDTIKAHNEDEEDMGATNELLKQIAGELLSLKQEISGLRSEVEIIKQRNQTSPEAEEEIDIPAPLPEKEKVASFLDEADDVALSENELGNIFASAEVTPDESPSEEVASVPSAGDENAKEVT
ncbi:MAG: hypothetical protein IJ828_09675, partial [Treponema sp.]|nr:hypothetical protein [Treponema sp.]